MSAFSFVDVQCTIAGPGGVFNIGSGSGAAEEGIDIVRDDDKTITTKGADGTVMFSLVASRVGSITVRLLQTSDANSQLMAMYNAQQLSSALWGGNTITVTHPASGDTTICSRVAFKKAPDIKYAQAGATYEWQFVAATVDSVLGTY